MFNKSIGKFALIASLVAATAMMYGCGSGKKEGASVGLNSVSPTGQVQSSISSVTIPADGKPVVKFALFDENGRPLDPTSPAFAAAAGSIRFTIARINADGNYQNYIKNAVSANSPDPNQPGYDSGGTITALGNGQFSYKFGKSLTDSATTLFGITLLDPNAPSQTHTVGIQIQRTITDSSGKPFMQVANPYFNFRPDGGAVTVTREVVSIDACNECHGKLGLHGGGRRDVALCILCHYQGPVGQQPVDAESGNSLDFKSMVHKIHMGKNLPTTLNGGSYNIVGFRNLTSNFSDVAYPFWTADGNDTNRPVQCVKCHRAGKDLAGRSFGKDVDKWKAAPKKSNCETCHDTLFNPTLSPLGFHVGMDDTTNCAGCHNSSTSKYLDTASTPDAIGAHTVLEQTSVNTGLHPQFISVTNSAAPGGGFIPTVTFKITNDAGAPVDPRVARTVGRFVIKLGYIEKIGAVPGVDYLNSGLADFGQPLSFSIYNDPTVPTGPVTDLGNGVFQITFPAGIPAGKAGVGVLGFESRLFYPRATFKFPAAATVGISGDPVQYYFDLATGAQVADPTQQRRKVADVAKCNACHFRLAKPHGGGRASSVQQCVICHNPNAAFNVTIDTTAFTSIDFKNFIHGIHSRAVTYPRDPKDCLACHFDNSVIAVPLKSGVFGTFTSPAYTGDRKNIPVAAPRIKPTTSVCTSCHNSALALSHTASMIVNGNETCAQCHTSGLTLGPDNVHKNSRPFPFD